MKKKIWTLLFSSLKYNYESEMVQREREKSRKKTGRADNRQTMSDRATRKLKLIVAVQKSEELMEKGNGRAIFLNE